MFGKKIVHGDGIGKKYLAHNDPRKNSLPAVNHPPPSKVKWSTPNQCSMDL